MPDQLSAPQLVLLIIILLLNMRSYLLYYQDKKRAIARKRNRIPEKQLLFSAFLLGGVGALLGMTTLRHKTKHLQFNILVPLAAATTVYAIIFIITSSI